MSEIAIPAYGSLISDPRPEIDPLVVSRVRTETPFPVEYARLSRSRGGAPTLVPRTLGAPVSAELLVLPDSISVTEAKDILYCREIGKPRSGRSYKGGTAPDAVLIRDQEGFCGIAHVLYTDFNPDGKIRSPDPAELARAAVDSVRSAPRRKNGRS